MSKTLGQVAFEGYSDGDRIHGYQWDSVGVNQAAWQAAAEAVVAESRRSGPVWLPTMYPPKVSAVIEAARYYVIDRRGFYTLLSAVEALDSEEG